MAGLVKLDTDGVISTPLAANEIGYSLVKDELYVGSGSGNGTFESEYRVTKNKEVLELDSRTEKLESTIPLIDFSRVESYVKEDGTRWLKNNGKGADGEMLSGQMLNFNALNQGATIGNIGGSIYSIFFSIKVPTTYTGSRFFRLNSALNIDIASNKLKVFAYTNNGYKAYTNTTSINDNLYHRVAIVFNSTYTNVSFYIDGILSSTITIPDILSITTLSDFAIGESRFSVTLSCNLGNLTVLNSIVDTSDIQLDYAQPELILGVATNTVSNNFSFTNSNILACLPLQEGIMSAGSVWNIKNGTSYAISNYTTTMWTNAQNLAYGIQDSLLVRDDINNFVTDLSQYLIEIPLVLSSGKGASGIKINEKSLDTSTLLYRTVSVIVKLCNKTLINNNEYVLSTVPARVINDSSLNTITTDVNGYIGSSVADTVYQHIVFRYRNINKNLRVEAFVNGTLVNTYFNSNYTTAVSDLFEIGYHLNNNDASSEIADYKVFDRELNDFEINELYNNIKTNAPTLALP